MKDYTLQDLKDAVRQAVADNKAPGSNRVTAALIAELPEPVQGLLVHTYTAILRGADAPESWHEAIIWLMPKGTATGNLDEYRPIAQGQQDMRMLMTPLMRRFTAVLAHKGLAADWQFGAIPGSRAAAPVFLAQRRLQRGQEENHVLAFDVSKALDTAPQGALALFLRHMGVPEELIRLFHTLSCGALVCIITAYGPTPSIQLHRGLRQGSAESAVLYLLLLEPLLRSLACKARGDARHTVPPLVQAYCDDLLLIAHSPRGHGHVLQRGQVRLCQYCSHSFDHGVPEPREHGGPSGMLTRQGHGAILGPAPQSKGGGNHEGETCTKV